MVYMGERIITQNRKDFRHAGIGASSGQNKGPCTIPAEEPDTNQNAGLD